MWDEYDPYETERGKEEDREYFDLTHEERVRRREDIQQEAEEKGLDDPFGCPF